MSTRTEPCEVRRVCTGVTIAALPLGRVNPERLRPVPARAEEWRRLYVAEYAGVANYCFQLQRDRDVAAETAQEAFTRLFTKWVRVQQPRHYVYRIATNLIRDSWSNKLRQRELEQALQGPAGQGAPAADVASVLALRSAVQALPPRLRPVILLHYYADMPIADVALALERPLGSIKRQLSEARELLAGQFQEEPQHG